MSLTSLPYPLEAERLACLASYHTADLKKDAGLDSIVQLAITIFRTPIALVSFLDAEWCWMRAQQGMELEKIERTLSFCHYTIEGEEVMVVENTLESPLFADNPFVTGPMGIRFYAGAPLVTKEGHRLGSLCIGDTAPRTFSEENRFILKELAHQVMTRLELGLREKELKKKTLSMMAYSRKLDSSRAELNQITHALSHEMKSPLRAIHNLAEWVSEELKDAPSADIKTNLSLMRNRVQRLDNLFNGLLGFFNASKTTDLPEQVGVFELVTSQIRLLQSLHPFKVSIAEDLPVLHTPKKVLATVFQQLLKNAVHHNPLPHLHLQIGWERYNDTKVVFFVQDNGHGIARQYQEHIFGIFKTFHHHPKQESTGIGLTLVKKMLEERDEQIWVDAEAGKGSRFSFTWAS